MAKYGHSDPSSYQLRDMQRRLTRAEARIERLTAKVILLGKRPEKTVE